MLRFATTTYRPVLSTPHWSHCCTHGAGAARGCRPLARAPACSGAAPRSRRVTARTRNGAQRVVNSGNSGMVQRSSPLAARPLGPLLRRPRRIASREQCTVCRSRCGVPLQCAAAMRCRCHALLRCALPRCATAVCAAAVRRQPHVANVACKRRDCASAACLRRLPPPLRALSHAVACCRSHAVSEARAVGGGAHKDQSPAPFHSLAHKK